MGRHWKEKNPREVKINNDLENISLSNFTVGEFKSLLLFLGVKTKDFERDVKEEFDVLEGVIERVKENKK